MAAPGSRGPAPLGAEKLPDPAVVEDRPGHYRTLTTARGGAPRRDTGSRNTVLAILVAVVALTGVVFIAFALSRSPNAVEPPAPTPAPPSLAPTSAPATTAEARPLPPSDEEVRVTIKTTPDRATVIAQDGVSVLGTTPHFIRRRKGAEAMAVTLQKQGFRSSTVSIGFASDEIYSFTLVPDAPVSASPP